jgi:hypothetical protein
MFPKRMLLTVALVLLGSVPAAGAAKVEWEAGLGWNNRAETATRWDAGFRTTGDWAFGENWAFFLRDWIAIDSETEEWGGILERCYLRYEAGPVRINLGRQAVSWGTGWFFRPTDRITPYSPLDKEETRSGKDLAVLRWSTSPVTAMELVAGDRLYAGRAELRIAATNLRLLAIAEPGLQQTLGFDFKGGLAGVYGEAGYTWTKEESFPDGDLTYSVGWEKILSGGNHFYLEYLRDQNGTVDRDDPGGGAYLALGLEIPWDELTTFTLASVSDLDNGGLTINGVVNLLITDSLDLRGQIGWSDDDTVAVSIQSKYYF